MEISYWKSRWRKNNTGWHMDSVYPPLPDLWAQLSIKSDANVLVPLCGKSLDLQWLSNRGHYVTGVEVSQKALHEVMDRHPEPFREDSSHGFTIFRSDSLELWAGDFLELPPQEIRQTDIIYDKASIVALPTKQRKRYAEKVLGLCNEDTQIILQTFEYNQEEMNGPPFSVDVEELKQYFGQRFDFTLVHEQSKLEQLTKFQRRGLSTYFNEKVYHLKPLHGDS